jgi:phenylacetate-CoA ligase
MPSKSGKKLEMETFSLQQWVENKIEQSTGTAEFNLEYYQLHRLQEVLNYAYEHSPFYRNLFDSNNTRWDRISSLRDLAQIPLTTPQDISRNPYRFLCVSLGDIARVFTFTTSGTTGPRKKAFYTYDDLKQCSNFMAACLTATEESDGAVQILLPRRSAMGQAELLAQGAKNIGRLPLLTGITLSTEGQVARMDEFKPSLLVGSVSRIYRVTQEACLHHDLVSKGVKAIIPTSEYLSEAMRRRLAQVWGCKVVAHYGLTEMGFAVAQECPAQHGFHVNEADFLVEVINPETSEVLPQGEEGELVFTTLNRKGMPLIRYRTHDISRLLTGRCSCGASLKRIDTVTKRIESAITLGGEEICPALFDDLLYEIPELIDYQAILGRKDNKDCLIIKLEMREGKEALSKWAEEAILSLPQIQRGLKAGSIAETKVEVVAQGMLRKVSRAKKLILDMRASGIG